MWNIPTAIVQYILCHIANTLERKWQLEKERDEKEVRTVQHWDDDQIYSTVEFKVEN